MIMVSKNNTSESTYAQYTCFIYCCAILYQYPELKKDVVAMYIFVQMFPDMMQTLTDDQQCPQFNALFEKVFIYPSPPTTIFMFFSLSPSPALFSPWKNPDKFFFCGNLKNS